MVSVILVSTHWTPTFENCRRSLHIHNYNYVVLGWDQVWSGWKWRAKLYYDHLCTLQNDDLVVLMDSFDAITTKDSSELIETFKAFKKPIVIGCEWWCGSDSNCGKVPNWWKMNNKTPALRSNINAGVIIGYVEKLREMYKWILDMNFDDDQKGIAKYIDQYGYDTVALDFGSALIYNSNIFDGFKTNKTSAIQHFPGPLLKKGFMPLYNKTVNKFLGVYGRKIYTDAKQESILTWILIFCVLICIFKFIKRY